MEVTASVRSLLNDQRRFRVPILPACDLCAKLSIDVLRASNCAFVGERYVRMLVVNVNIVYGGALKVFSVGVLFHRVWETWMDVPLGNVIGMSNVFNQMFGATRVPKACGPQFDRTKYPIFIQVRIKAYVSKVDFQMFSCMFYNAGGMFSVFKYNCYGSIQW